MHLRLFSPGRPQSSHQSRLYHTDAVAERVRAILRKHTPVRRADCPIPDLFVRIVDDDVTVSVAASGPRPMHMRGARGHVGAAPMRETLAAACVLGALEELGLLPQADADAAGEVRVRPRRSEPAAAGRGLTVASAPGLSLGSSCSRRCCLPSSC